MDYDLIVVKTIMWMVYFIFFFYSVFWFLGLFEKPSKKRSIFKQLPTVTIVIPVYNGSQYLRETLNSVFNLDYPKEKVKIICVNDGSTDNTLKILKELRKKHTFDIINQKNQGKYVALNNGLKQTKSRLFACLDCDSIVEPNTLRQLVSEFTSNDVAATMPVMKVLYREHFIERIQHFEYMTSIFLKRLMDKRDCVHVTPGPFTVYRSDILKEIKGFRKGHFVEDLEVALRIQASHYKMRQSLEATVSTISPDTLKKYHQQRLRWYRGTFANFIDYRKFLFRKQYGDFGTVHWPMVGIGGILTLTAVFALIYLQIKIAYSFSKKFFLTNFDFLTYLKTLSFEFNLLTPDYFIVFLLVALLTLSITLIVLSMRSNKERFSKEILSGSIVYLLTYSYLTAFIWLAAFRDIVFKRPERWMR